MTTDAPLVAVLLCCISAATASPAEAAANYIQIENAKPGTHVGESRRPDQTVRKHIRADVHDGCLPHGALRRAGRAAHDGHGDAEGDRSGPACARSSHRPDRMQLDRSVHSQYSQLRRCEHLDERDLPGQTDRRHERHAFAFMTAVFVAEICDPFAESSRLSHHEP